MLQCPGSEVLLERCRREEEEALKKELEISKIQVQINKRIEDRLSTQQRQFFLKEQLKEIKKELDNVLPTAVHQGLRDLPFEMVCAFHDHWYGVRVVSYDSITVEFNNALLNQQLRPTGRRRWIDEHRDGRLHHHQWLLHHHCQWHCPSINDKIK